MSYPPSFPASVAPQLGYRPDKLPAWLVDPALPFANWRASNPRTAGAGGHAARPLTDDECASVWQAWQGVRRRCASLYLQQLGVCQTFEQAETCCTALFRDS